MLVLALEFSRGVPAHTTTLRPFRARRRACTGRVTGADRGAPGRAASPREGPKGRSLKTEEREPGAAGPPCRRRTGSRATVPRNGEGGAPLREWEAIRHPSADACDAE